MNEKKLSPKWHLIFLGLAAFVALSIYPIWHVFIAEKVVNQAECDGRVAKVVVYYTPSSLTSYLGAYLPEMRSCGAKLIVKDRDGTIMKTMFLVEGTYYDLPTDIATVLQWRTDGTELTVFWNANNPGITRLHFPR